MEIQELTVKIAADGTVKVEVRGLQGPQCLELTAALEKLLGGEVIHRERTPEYDQQQSISQDTTLHQGA